ncbi:MAG: phosphohydrolase [Patescibacteria group bacterium]
MQLTFKQVKTNLFVNDFIKQTEKYLKALGYTDHGFRHTNIVADRAMSLAKKVGLSKREQELSAISGYCHDMGNFLGRSWHHYWAAMLFSQVFMSLAAPEDLSTVMQAIVSHDKDDLKLVSKVSAILILADKSDVHRTRVQSKGSIKTDIHDRVNWAATDNQLSVDSKRKEIILKINIDTKLADPIEYFEIFINRMTFCRLAAKYLGYKFVLMINNYKLS